MEQIIKKIFAKMQPSPAEKAAHAVPLWLLSVVFVTLLFFTWMTTWVTQWDLGNLNLYIALAIAVIKATVVALYFMHLRWDRPFNGYIFLGAVIFVALFIAFALTDTQQYQHSVIWGEKWTPPASVGESAAPADTGSLVEDADTDPTAEH